MQNYYNMNQTTLNITLDYSPTENHIARYMHQLVEGLKEMTATKKVSPQKNSTKQQRRTVTSQKLDKCRDKMCERQTQQAIYGQRNSYAKTNHDVSFMWVKEDPIQIGQLNTAYNFQIGTSHQFVAEYQLFRNPIDKQMLPTFKNQ